MFIVVAYDITDDHRRTRLFKRLKGFGTPVQYSVFECLIDDQQPKAMQTMMRKTIDTKQDGVRYYRLCESCQAKIITINGPVTTIEQTIVV